MAEVAISTSQENIKAPTISNPADIRKQILESSEKARDVRLDIVQMNIDSDIVGRTIEQLEHLKTHVKEVSSPNSTTKPIPAGLQSSLNSADQYVSKQDIEKKYLEQIAFVIKGRKEYYADEIKRAAENSPLKISDPESAKIIYAQMAGMDLCRQINRDVGTCNTKEELNALKTLTKQATSALGDEGYKLTNGMRDIFALCDKYNIPVKVVEENYTKAIDAKFHAMN